MLLWQRRREIVHPFNETVLVRTQGLQRLSQSEANYGLSEPAVSQCSLS